MKQLIATLSDQLFPYVCSHYYYLHNHPELSFEEKETARYICHTLDDIGIEYRNNVGGHGVVATLPCNNPGKRIIALRADMDALPIQEETGLSYASQTPHVMHACGHDAHVASLLGVAQLLHMLREYIDGTILFVFQPAEERHPGGARLMLEDNLFGDTQPELMIAQHVYVDLPVGHVAIGGGTVMASADEIHFTVRGTGGHGALPHLLNDTVLAASQTVVALQQVVSRRRNPFEPTVLSIGKFIADGATNIIPNEVHLSGSLRCVDQQSRMEIRKIIHQVIDSTAAAHGCTANIHMPDGYPPTYNNPQLADQAAQFAADYLGAEAVHPLIPRMTAEDFGFFSQRYPSLFYRFGVKGENNATATGLHTSHFSIDVEALRTGVACMAHLTLSFLHEGKQP